jgi:hypothetical protein
MALGLPVALVVPSLGLGLSPAPLAVQASGTASRAATASHGPPGGVYGGRSSQNHPMSLRLTRDGKRLRSWFVHVDASSCSSSPTRGYSMQLQLNSRHAVRVRAHGSFAGTGRFRGRTQAGDKLDFKVAMKGRLGRTRARGRLRVFGPVRDASGKLIDRCDSGAVRWRLRRGRVYGGATDNGDGGAVSIRLGRHGKRIKSFFIDLKFLCDDSTDPLLSLNHLSVAVRRDGRISKHGFSGIPLKIPGGATVSGQFSLRGKLGRRRAHGSYRAFGSVRRPDGSTLHCDSGAARWMASRG